MARNCPAETCHLAKSDQSAKRAQLAKLSQSSKIDQILVFLNHGKIWGGSFVLLFQGTNPEIGWTVLEFLLSCKAL